MKVGLLTFHDTNNFGSYLQTYGLYKKIVDFGCDCEIINYQCKNLVERELPRPFKFTLNPRTLLRHLLIDRLTQKKYNNLITGFLRKNMKLSPRYDRQNIQNSSSRYDIILVGSDIVWGMDITAGDTAYFLDFEKDSKKKYAFSSSVGNPWCNEDKVVLKPYLQEFSGIAVREEESANWVEELTGKRPNVVCDPTMLLKSSEWATFKSDKYVNQKYVLVYFYTNESLRAARALAKKEKCDCYVINYGLPIVGTKSVKPLTIADFLALIYNAHFVVTASYHGMLFSIYFNRQFAFFNRAHKSRMNTLAGKLNVTDRDGSVYDVLCMKPVDYSVINGVVESYREQSINCLKRFLDNESNNL